MDENRFKQLLAERNVAVVHFSHHSPMTPRVAFPLDLHHAIKCYETEQRSCCAIFPGHEMSLPGSVGVIFEPTHSQVLWVCSSDSGTSDLGSAGVEPTEDTILESLRVPRGSYNEWVILGAAPVAIFVADPGNIEVKKEVIITGGEEEFPDIHAGPISLQDVRAAFPRWPIYTMRASGLKEVP